VHGEHLFPLSTYPAPQTWTHSVPFSLSPGAHFKHVLELQSSHPALHGLQEVTSLYDPSGHVLKHLLLYKIVGKTHLKQFIRFFSHLSQFGCEHLSHLSLPSNTYLFGHSLTQLPLKLMNGTLHTSQ
jgi:hypothetical protein